MWHTFGQCRVRHSLITALVKVLLQLDLYLKMHFFTSCFFLSFPFLVLLFCFFQFFLFLSLPDSFFSLQHLLPPIAPHFFLALPQSTLVLLPLVPSFCLSCYLITFFFLKLTKLQKPITAAISICGCLGNPKWLPKCSKEIL